MVNHVFMICSIFCVVTTSETQGSNCDCCMVAVDCVAKGNTVHSNHAAITVKLKMKISSVLNFQTIVNYDISGRFVTERVQQVIPHHFLYLYRSFFLIPHCLRQFVKNFCCCWFCCHRQQNQQQQMSQHMRRGELESYIL